MQLYILFLALAVVTLLAWFAVLFTGRYPQSLFQFASGVLRWQANVTAYIALLRDEYPPWSLNPRNYPATLEVPLAERQSRFRLFIRWFAILPNQFVFFFVSIAWLVTSVIAWFAILFSARYPRGLFDFSVGVIRWMERSSAYAYLLRDEYPPYSTSAEARPGNEVLSAVIRLPMYVGYVALWFTPLALQNFRVESSSMEPSLRGEQYLLVNKAIYFRIDGHHLFRSPRRGDVVVFRFPLDPSRDFMKRVIGEPGDTVEIRDETVFINGSPLKEDYIQATPNYQYAPKTVPPGEYFVLGDNRRNSFDSHAWGAGCSAQQQCDFVPEGNIIGQAWISYWPWDDFGFVNNKIIKPLAQ